MKSATSLLSLLFLCAVLVTVSASKNNHQSRRKLQGAQPFRIFVSYDESDKANPATDVNYAKYTFAKKIMEKTKYFYTLVLKVKNPKPTYTWPDVNAADNSFDVAIKGRTVAYDLWTYFKAYFKDDNGFAAAAPFAFDDTTGRPIVGGFELNLNAISPSPANLINHMGTFVHEFYHIVVFNNQLYEKFVGSDLKPVGRASFVAENIPLNGIRMGYIGTNVLAYAKEYTNFPGLTHVLMENNGGAGSAGSHWEHMYWSTEFMSPTDTTPSMHTKLSFAMAIDSGWFEIDENYMEKYSYLHGAGYNFQTGACPTTAAEFAKLPGLCPAADAGKKGCSPDLRFKSECYTDTTYSEGCYFMTGKQQCSVPDMTDATAFDLTIEKVGDASRCADIVKNSVNTPLCGQASCDASNLLTWTFVTGSCSCTAAQSKLAGTCTDNSLSITCPDVADICSRLATRCPKDCSGKGLCLNYGSRPNCLCVSGSKGVDCSEIDTDNGSGNSAGLTALGYKGGSSLLIEMSTGLIMIAGLLQMVIVN